MGGARSAVVEIAAGRLLRRTPVMVESIVPWGPRAGAWRHTHEAGWQAFEPRIDLPKLERAAEAATEAGQARAARFLLESWPEDARRAAAGYREDTWLLLMHANYCGREFVELLRTHAPLALLVAHRQRFQPLDKELATWDGARELLRLRRRAIAERLGFPGTERTVRVLSRVRADALALNTLRTLRTVLAGEAQARRLAYLPSINGPVASVLAHGASALLAHACLVEIAELDAMPEIDSFLQRLERIARLAHLPAPFASIATAENYQRRLPPAVRHEDQPDFPPPPVAETETIRAIRSAAELRAEGERMHHCCAGYSQRVLQRDAYFYRLLAPMRLTVCLHPTAQGWTLEEARGRMNERPSREALQAVNEWLVGSGAMAIPQGAMRQAVPALRPRRRRRRRVDPAQMVFDFEGG